MHRIYQKAEFSNALKISNMENLHILCKHVLYIQKDKFEGKKYTKILRTNVTNAS